jgi:hypothetical protein
LFFSYYLFDIIDLNTASSLTMVLPGSLNPCHLCLTLSVCEYSTYSYRIAISVEFYFSASELCQTTLDKHPKVGSDHMYY